MKCEHTKLREQAREIDMLAFNAAQNRDYKLLSDFESQTRKLQEKGCLECGKSCNDMAMDPQDDDPTTKPSQQVIGQRTMYCGQCEMYVKPTTWHGEEVCPYHQRVHHGQEGPEMMYEEFNEDGEEW